MKTKLLLKFGALAITSGFLNAQITNPAPYCAADFDHHPSGGPIMNVQDAIFSVSFGTLLNVTDAQYAFPHYVFYNNLAVPNFAQGSTSNNLMIDLDVYGGVGYGVWIDYNQDGVFDGVEKIMNSAPGGVPFIGTGPVSKMITIPTTATLGNTRMRVRIVEDDMFNGFNNFMTEPCNATTSVADVMDWGETEDYTINITAAPVGVNELESDEAKIITVYPNPTSGSFAIDLKTSAQVSICNLLGEQIFTKQLQAGKHSLDITNQATGVYFVRVKTENTQQQVKIIKE
jgi:hypothetical protein